jgi:hypothetical protein
MGGKTSKYPFFARYAATIVDNGFTVVAVLPESKRPRYEKWHAACFKDTDPTFFPDRSAAFPRIASGSLAERRSSRSTLMKPIPHGQMKSIASL